MENYARIFHTEGKHGYSVNSGVFAIVDDNLRMELDPFGNYQAVRVDESRKVSSVDRELSLVSAMSDESPNENEVARNLFGAIPDIRHHPVLGYYLGLYAGYVKEDSYRTHGSSGGFTTWLLVQLLENGYIDGVVHVKACDPGDGVLFQYGVSRTEEEIRDGAKSRYYPAEFSDAIKDVLAQGGRYAVTGIPSFIMELRLLARIDPEVAAAIPFTFGLICGHQKSTKYAEAMAWQQGIEPGNLISIDFRKKSPDAPASRYLTEIHGRVGDQVVEVIKPQNEFFISNWGHGFFKAKMSDYTDDAFNETSDVSLGDAWLPQYVSDSAGTNVLIVRHPVIEKLIRAGVEEDLIHVEPLDEETMLQSQRGLVHHTQDEIGYRLHSADKEGKWRPRKRFEASNDLPFIRKRVQDIRKQIAHQSHIVYAQAVENGDWSQFEKTMIPLVKRYHLYHRLTLLSRQSPMETLKKIARRALRRF